MMLISFKCESILRKNAVTNGIVLDMKMYSLIKELTLYKSR